jgi:tetraacyldisaccharide 4'-kinase
MADLTCYFRDLTEGKKQGCVARIVLLLLTLLSFPYLLIIRLRAIAYSAGVFSSRRLDRPVISVGNLTVGGTGKTPAVAMLAQYFIARGKRVVVLSRGYGGTLRGRVWIVADGRDMLLNAEAAGDEPYLLAATVPGLAVVVGADRYRAGLLAMERLAPDIFILDDGFQHLRLARDLNILLLDSMRPFSNGKTLPAGLLREPPSAAERADLIIYTRCSSGEELDRFPAIPACRAFHHLAGVTPLGGGEPRPFADLNNLRGVAFAGIADPVPFFHDLEEEGLTLAARLSFPDHCRYGEKEVAQILGASASHGADYLITTEKDGVKLGPHRERLANVYTASLEMWVADPGPLVALLEKLL